MKFLPNTIINFHDVYDNEWMNRVLLLLKRNYQIIGINEVEKYFYEGHKLKNACHITFDDGDLSFYNIVFPLLKKYQIPVSIYVSPLMVRERKNFWFQEIRGYDPIKLRQILEKTNPTRKLKENKIPSNALLKTMSIQAIWDVIHHYQEETGTPTKSCLNMTPIQLLELHKSGLVAIGAHTLYHPILQNESDKISFFEIKSSIEELNEMLHFKVKHFAYPNGKLGLDFGQREINILKDCGIRLSFSTENRSFKRKDNVFNIPRKVINSGSPVYIKIRLFLGPMWDFLTRLMMVRQEGDYRKEFIKI